TQPAVDAEVRAAVARLPNVQVELGVEVTGLQQDAQAAALTLADGRRVDARWVVACDGASSTLRGLAGLTLDDLGFDEPWLVVDVLANERGLAKLPPTSVQYCEPARPCTLVIGPKNHRRWEISLDDGDDPRQAETPEGTWALLERWITPDDGQLWRQASYRFHALMAQRWRAGRLFIAGDAAHQQPPFLGQGMCQGIRDVVNLAWKLDAVIKRQAGDALLDSYGIERGRHVRELTTRLKSIGALIGERDAVRAHARDERLLAEAGGSVRPQPRQDVLPRLQGGALARDDSPARGTLFPQPWLQREGERVRMDDVAGTGWRLVQCDSTPPPDVVLPGLRTLSLPDLNEADGVLAAWFRTHHCSAALVRPDHCIFGTAADTAAVPELMAQARAALH
ncbi:MAG TPA: FAD-dependent monooxygenase, partial [Burkholderiaceae bacterium]|nr:FAD-dependent monooxygenase [Burkholderiaceae bacterium]